jgi:hypothetical protein
MIVKELRVITAVHSVDSECFPVQLMETTLLLLVDELLARQLGMIGVQGEKP